MEDFRKEFLENIAKCEQLNAKVDKSNITFSVKEEFRPLILDVIRQTAMEQLETVGASLVNEKFFDITLPIFSSDK